MTESTRDTVNRVLVEGGWLPDGPKKWRKDKFFIKQIVMEPALKKGEKKKK